MKTRIIIELEIQKVNGIKEKNLRHTEGFRKGAESILNNLISELPNHFRKFRMVTKAVGRIEIPKGKNDKR